MCTTLYTSPFVVLNTLNCNCLFNIFFPYKTVNCTRAESMPFLFNAASPVPNTAPATY